MATRITLFELLVKGLTPARAYIYDYDMKPITSIPAKTIKYSHNISDVPVVDWWALPGENVAVRLYCLRQDKPKDETCSIRENPCTWRNLVDEKARSVIWRRCKDNAYPFI